MGIIRFLKQGRTLILPLVWLTLLNSAVQAQLIPDHTLDTENSIVSPQGVRDFIEGGARRGSNLFHSFAEFNVNLDQQVYFANPDGITNILTRVTGDTISNIFGTLGVDGNANLFLLNPNGILFGTDAQLDVAGSFIASTADGIKLGNDGVFRATNPQDSQLLTIQPGVLFLDALRQQQAEIRNQGNLSVGAGQTLTLAGDRVISTGSLTAPGGTVQVFGEEVQLLETAQIDVSSLTGGGSVTIGQGEQVTIAEGVQIQADSLNQGDGGRVIIRANETTQFEGTITARGASATPQSNGGFVDVSGGYLEFTGIVDTTAPLGNVGTLLLDPKNIWIQDDGVDAADGQTFETNPTEVSIINGDTLVSTLATNSVTLQANNDIVVNQSMFSFSDNSLNLQAGRSITINQLISLSGGNFTAKINDENAIASQRDAGVAQFLMNPGSILVTNGGSIEITSGTFADTSQINTANTSIISSADAISDSGSSGDINLFALGNVTTGIVNTGRDLTGDVVANNGGNITVKSENGAIATTNFVTSDGINQGGEVLLEASGDLSVNQNITSTSTEGIGGNITLNSKNGAIATSALVISDSLNQGGDIFVDASGNLDINGEISSRGEIGGNITLNSENGAITTTASLVSEGSNQGGKISLDAAGTLTTMETIIANSQNQAGDISLNAIDDLSVNGDITTGGAIGGEITLKSEKGAIATTAPLVSEGSNQAGDISVEANGNISVSVDITSRSLEGMAGQITLTSGGLFEVTGNGISTISRGSDIAKGITITASSLQVTEAPIVAVASNDAQGGIVLVNAADDIVLRNSNLGTFADSGSADAGDVILNTRRLTIIQDPQTTVEFPVGVGSSTALENSGNTGNVTINATEFLEIIGNQPGAFNPNPVELAQVVLQGDTGISTFALGSGNSGNLTINTGQLSIRDGGGITTFVNQGEGGDLTVNATDVSLQGEGGIGTGTLGEDAGDLTLNAENVTLTDGALISTSTGRDGNAGNLTLEVRNLSIRSGAGVLGNAGADGNGGQLTIKNAEFVEVIGKSADGRFPSSIATDAFSPNESGNAGNINITSQELMVQKGGEITSATRGFGDGGNIRLNLENLQLNNGRINASTSGSGNGGDININSPTSELNIRDRAAVSVSATGTGNAGDINVDIRSIFLDQGSISATSLSGEGGNINLKVAETLILRNNSQISTRAGTESSGGGNGGDMTIDANFIVGVLSENSDLTANAFAGNGGNITITTQTILGLQVSDELTPNSDITASSKLGIDGSIVINTPNIDPSRGLFELPLNFFDASQQLVSGCPADTGDRFIVTGRGGIPNSPSQYLSGRAIWEDTRRLSSQISPSSTPANSQLSQTNTPPLIEAQGWVVDQDGMVILTAQPYRGKQVNIGMDFRTCGSQLNL